MTGHELARRLLELPDAPVDLWLFDEDCGGDADRVTFDAAEGTITISDSVPW